MVGRVWAVVAAWMLGVAAIAGGCKWVEDETPAEAKASISCVAVDNGPVADCARTVTGWIAQAHADAVIDAGIMSRSEMISGTVEIQNTGGSMWTGYVEARFDAGCNGAAEWVLMPMQAIEVEAGQTQRIAAGGSCGDMPLGPREFVATAFGPDQTTVVDRVVVRFNLVD